MAKRKKRGPSKRSTRKRRQPLKRRTTTKQRAAAKRSGGTKGRATSKRRTLVFPGGSTFTPDPPCISSGNLSSRAIEALTRFRGGLGGLSFLPRASSTCAPYCEH
jgi:hypothetical protein